MLKWYIRGVIPLLSLIVIVGVMFGQDDENTNNDLSLRCDYDTLVEEQANLQASLDAFTKDAAEDPQTALETLYTVGERYQTMALECGFIPDNAGDLYIGTDIDLILAILDEINGDPLSGQLLYNNVDIAADGNLLGCVGCHMQATIAPLTEGTWTRWDEIRSLEPEFADYTFEQYIVESIVHPWDYIVTGYPQNTMPNNFGERLNYQNLADILAYLESQDQLLED